MPEKDIRNPDYDEETLDPESWDDVRELGHRMVDDMVTYLSEVRDRPVWQPIPGDVKAYFEEPLPQEPCNSSEVYNDFLEYIQPYPMGNIHPRFWGWVIGTGTTTGMFAEMLAAGMNPNVGGGDHIANYVEAQVIQWFIEAFGFPPSSSGLLVSGGSMANLVGLTVARNTKAGFDIRTEGVHHAPTPLTIYGSTETHNSVQKAVELLGLGDKAFRRIPVNDSFQIDIEKLETVIAEDRAQGLQPICIIGNAGTVNTGAVDDLEALAEISSRENLWYHVDGAFGSLAALSPELRQLVDGLERADSLAFDLHKWMYMPFEIGCALVREEEAHLNAFSLSADYLEHNERGVGAGTRWFSDYGVQLSRGFRALKAWMSIKEYGIRKYGRLIKQNVEQAAYLSELIDTSDNLERLAPTSLNIVCFRFVADGVDEFLLNAINREILLRLHESGVAVPSYTSLKGKYALRVAITNHRSQRGDFDILVDEVTRLGQDIQSNVDQV